MDAGPHTRGSGRDAASGRRLGHGGPESRRPPRRPPPRRARRHRDRRPSRGGCRATDREPDPVQPDAARPAAPRPSPRRAHRGAADPPPRPGSGRPRAARRGGPLPVTIRDRAAIVGIGQTPFAKHLGRSEYDMAVEAILAACDDAGISPRAIDGVVRYDMETTDEENLLAALGNPCLRSFACTAWGGGGAASTVVLAAQAPAAGAAPASPAGRAARGPRRRRHPPAVAAAGTAAARHRRRGARDARRARDERRAPRRDRGVGLVAAVPAPDLDVHFFREL